jgi:hypothetical protein
MFCKWCGVKLISNASVCTQCGGSIKPTPYALPKQAASGFIRAKVNAETSIERTSPDAEQIPKHEEIKKFLRRENINAENIITGVLGNSPMIRFTTRAMLSLFKEK